MSLRDGLIGHFRELGLRGVAAISAYRLFGRPTEITTQPPGIQNPIHLRLRTTDLSTYVDILRKGEYSFDLPFSPKTIVDAGANIGMASIYLAHKYPDAKIIAVEAEASNFDVLARNVQPYPAITPVHAALWKREGEIGIAEPNPATGASGKWGFVSHDGPGERVRAITMNTLMREMRIPAIDLAKIDIEGAEQEVFEDTRWLAGTRSVMIELHDRFRPGCSKVVESAMHDFARSQRGETVLYVRAA